MSARVDFCWGNRYVSCGKIGSGSYGIVHKVKDTQAESEDCKFKALKEIPVINMDSEQIEECAREAKILVKLNYENIVRIYDYFNNGDYYCIVTEYCDGGDLDKLIVKKKRAGEYLEEKLILHWFIQIIHALQYIHQKRILHRDLKSRNIFIRNNIIKLGDFGISRILNFTMDLASTFVGTSYYMSPEVLKHEGYNTMSDVWSAGVILFEMCSLEHPFNGKGLMDIMMKIVKGDTPKIPEIYSEKMQNLIESILIKDPANRPSAGDILQFEYILKAIKDPWIDEASDLNRTLKAEDSNPISKSPNNKLKQELTPKQKSEIRKKIEAEKRAAQLKEYGPDIYKENKEITMKQKNERNVSHLPFTNRTYQHMPNIATDVEDSYLRSKTNYKIKGSKSMNEPYRKQEPEFEISPNNELNKTFNFYDINPNHIPMKNSVEIDPLPSRQNQNELYNVMQPTENDEEMIQCRVKPFDTADIPESELINYEYPDDFEDVSSDSDGSRRSSGAQIDDIDTQGSVRFQDDSNTDPFGPSARQKKIESMIKKCKSYIDEVTLKKCMKVFNSDKKPSDKITEVKKLCKKDDVAFLMEQIHFLNNKTLQIY